MEQAFTRIMIVVLASCCFFGQPAAPPSFEVASVKLNKLDTRGFIGPTPAAKAFRGFAATNARLKVLIMLAYGISEQQLSGGPGWIESDGFDIEAKAENPTSYQQIHLMLQTLLADRFQLKLRRETREEPVYALVVEKESPTLHPNEDGAPPLITAGGNPAVIVCRNIPMSRLAWMLSGPQQVGRPVLDKTGLEGGYDFELVFSRISSKPQDAGPHDGSGPSIVTAVRKLGLNLVSQRGPCEYFMIEHVEKPSEN